MSCSVEECRPIPGQRWHHATSDGEIRRPERRVFVKRYRRTIGGKQYLKVLEQRTIRPYRGRVRLRQPDGKIRSMRLWRLIASAFIGRILKTDRCEFLDGNSDNCNAGNLRIVRASGKRLTLPRNGGAV